MILYLLQSSLALLLLIGIYYLFLRKTKLFQFNRIYLLASLLLALLIPGLQIEIESTVLPIANDLQELSQFSESVLPTFAEELQIGAEKSSTSKLPNILFTIYLAVAIALLLRFAFNLFQLLSITNRKGPILAGMQTVLIPNKSNPFSFMGYLYVQQEQLEEIISNSSLLNHEKAHCHQRHSLDILFIEFIQCILWFNPILLLFKKAIKANHEYLADAFASEKETDTSHYLKSLLQFIELRRSNPLTSGFGYLIIKNRIKMIHYSKPNTMKRTTKLATGISLAIVILISSAFSPAPIEDQLISPLLELEEKTPNIPSILPIKKEEIVKVGSHYGMRYNPLKKGKQMHTGIDISAAEGTAILATADGTVEVAEYSNGYGNHIKIKHDEIYQSMYAHLASMNVKNGQEVKKGDVIGIIGNTGKSLGTHLHYEVNKGEEKVNPADYFPYEISTEEKE